MTDIFDSRRYDSFKNATMNTTFYKIYVAQSVCGQKSLITLPRNITQLGIELALPEAIKLPKTITHICYRQMSSPNFWKSIPQSVTHIIMSGHRWNFPMDYKLSVTHLTLMGGPAIKYVPDAITHLTLNNFSEPLNNLLAHVTHLTLVGHYDYAVNNLPQTITHLTFSEYFNNSYGTLPSKLTHLTFGDYYNRPVKNLPDTITHLTFGNKFNHPANNLPQSLTHLTFGYNFNQPVTQLPSNITHLTFGNQFAKSVAKLPSSVTHLVLGQNFRCKLNKLPHCLAHLTLSVSYTHVHLPSTITVVRI